MPSTMSRPRALLPEGHLQDADDHECVICSSPLAPNGYIDLPCGHAEFCVTCLMTYLSKRMETYGINTPFPCPLCRADVRIDVGTVENEGPLGFAADGAPLHSAIAIRDVLGNAHPVWLSPSPTLDSRCPLYDSRLLETGETVAAFRPSSHGDSTVRGGLVWNDPSRGYVAVGAGPRLASRGLVRLKTHRSTT